MTIKDGQALLIQLQRPDGEWVDVGLLKNNFSTTGSSLFQAIGNKSVVKYSVRYLKSMGEIGVRTHIHPFLGGFRISFQRGDCEVLFRKRPT